LVADLEFWTLRPGQEQYRHSGRAINMSRNGLLFETDHSLEAGTAVELWIEWPAHPPDSDRWLCVWGWVISQNGRLAAIAIRQYSFEDQRRKVQAKPRSTRFSLPAAVQS
jgi:hypothetical protein